MYAAGDMMMASKQKKDRSRMEEGRAGPRRRAGGQPRSRWWVCDCCTREVEEGEKEHLGRCEKAWMCQQCQQYFPKEQFLIEEHAKLCVVRNINEEREEREYLRKLQAELDQQERQVEERQQRQKQQKQQHLHKMLKCLNQIKIIVYPYKMLEVEAMKPHEDREGCPVCLAKYGEGDLVGSTPCTHRACLNCIYNYYVTLQKSSCMMCRTPLF